MSLFLTRILAYPSFDCRAEICIRRRIFFKQQMRIHYNALCLRKLNKEEKWNRNKDLCLYERCYAGLNSRFLA